MSATHRGPAAPCSLVVAGLVSVLAFGWTAEPMAQTQFNPYYGKNRVKYDDFEWHIYESDHFEIFYYPELEEHLGRLASYAESAYAQISADLTHDLATRVPLVVFKTHSEFEQQNIAPGQSPEGVGAFAEPFRRRIVLPIDEPPDQLYRLITHELTHQFAFDIIPRSVIRRGIPLWVDEGLADYMAGVWRPLDLMAVRDAALSDIVPRMSEFLDYGGFANARVVYNLGHAAFEFIEDRWGKEGVRQFLFSLRKTVIGGGGDIYEDAFDIPADEFDDEFESYIRRRFQAFRDKERPDDYGRNLAPDPLKTRYPAVVSIEPSPSGDLIAAFAQNRKNRELDIVLLSAHDGTVVSNLTEGFDQDLGFESIGISGNRWNSVPWMSWGIDDRLAYFARRGKYRSLVLQNVVTRRVEDIIELDLVDQPESPDISPDGRTVAFSALQGAVGDLYLLDLETRDLTNLTTDELADYAPTFSPDGSYLVYLTRVSGNDKVFRLDLATKAKTQLTFGTSTEAAAQFLDDHTLVFSSTATDPLAPTEPDVAANGDIFNVWTLDLNNGELRQFTDTANGNVSTIVLPGADATRIAFVTYFKGEYGVHSLVRDEPLYTASTTDFGGPGPNIDFQAPLTHNVVAANARRKGRFEKMFLDGTPPVSVGVTNSGDLLGGTAISFSDVLGDQSFSLFAYSIQQYRTLSASYLNLSGRLQFALQGFSQEEFFFGTSGFYSPALAFLSRDQALAVRTVRGGSAFGIYPFDRFRRIELSGGLFHYNERFDNPALQQESERFQQQQFGAVDLFRNGATMPVSVSFIQETTVFREFGPIAGNTMRFGYQYAPSIGSTLLGKQTVEADARYYLRLGETGLLALRGKGFMSLGDYPDFLYFGGNSEMRGYEYLEFIGHEAGFVNAELRFPLVEAMLTPVGVLGGIRGTFFFNLGGASLKDEPFRLFSRSTETVTPTIGFGSDPETGEFLEVFGEPNAISGFRLVDGRAAYGLGLQTFVLGFPAHFDWSWRTLFNKGWEDVVFATQGGSAVFREPRFDFWIGYDF